MTPSIALRLRSHLALLLLLLAPALGAPAAAAARRTFDLPAGPAESALKRFSMQAGLQLVFAAELTDGVRTNAVRGEFTALEAADRLLAGTPLRVVHDDKTGVFSITREPVTEKNVPRVAQATPGERRPPTRNAETPSINDSADAAVTLSPFEVHAEHDTGYAASGTLMGTRLNTELKDVAASVSAITKDFMIDVNAHDMERLLVYTLGTEVAGMGGNFSNATDSGGRYSQTEDANRDATPATRLRGLGSADNTRDFFLSSIPMDGYNVDRVEISRGPNAMLFGLGAPAGVINSSLIKAETRRTKTGVDTQFGSYGTYRASLDHNQVLARDQLAVRAAAVYSKRNYRIEHAYREDRRGFVAATYRPFRSTTIKANFELGAADFALPKNRPPLDMITPWWDLGMPLYDPTTGQAQLLGTPREGFPSGVNSSGGLNGSVMNATQFGDAGWRAAMIFSDPASSTPGVSTVPGAVIFKTRGDRVRQGPTGLLDSAMATLINGASYLRFLHRNEPSMNFWRWPQISDPRIFDFYHHTFDGPNNDGYTRFHAYNVVLEQRALEDRLGLEVAYDYQDMQHMTLDASSAGTYTVFLDINTKLLNGAPNPNVGRPAFASGGNQRISDVERRAARATAYYNVDLRKAAPGRLGRILGRHTITVSYTDQEIYTFGRGGQPMVVGTDYEMYEYDAIAAKTSASRGLPRLVYIGPSLIGTAGPQDMSFQPITARLWPDSRGPFLTMAARPPPVGATTLNPWEVRPFTINANDREDIHTVSSANKHRDRFKSGVAILTNRWLDDKLISFLSWRRDEYQSFDAGGAPLDPATGTLLLGPDAYRVVPTNSGAEAKFTYGLTAHAPEFVRRRLPFGADFSLYYNRSDNFRPQAQRYNVFDEPIDPESGETEEYGFRLSLFRGKFELRATNYETSASLAEETGVRQGILAIANRVEAAIEQISTPGGFYQTQAAGGDQTYVQGIAAFNQWLETPGAQQLMRTFRFVTVTNPNGSKQITTSARTGEVIATTDTVSKGWEIEAILNPTRNWRIAFNANQQEAIKTNTAGDLRRLVDTVWAPLVNSPFGAMRSTNNTLSFLDESQGTVFQPLRRVELLQGSRAPEIREWSWRGTTRYAFSEGRLRGVSLGGSVRWAEGGAIGYPVIVDPSAGGAIIDVTNPYFSPSETTFDAFIGYTRRLGRRLQWSLRFHVRNIGIGNELIPQQAQPDGTIAGYRIREPQNWTITNSFSF